MSPVTEVPCPLPPSDRARAREGFEDARADHGDLGVSLADFEARLALLSDRHWRAQGAVSTPSRVAEFVGGAHLADLHLAAACEAGTDGAWEMLFERYRRRLEMFSVRRGASPAEAESLVQDLLGDLSHPPPRGEGRTLIGNYDGTGSLHGWLSIVLLRRIQAKARLKKTASLDAQPAGIRDAALPQRESARPPEASKTLETSEATIAFADAFDRAWPTLSTQERLALVLKHRDEWTQRRIADAIGVGEARVSRVVSGAVEKLAKALTRSIEAFGTDRADVLWQAFSATLASRLASSGPVPALAGSGAPGGGSPVGRPAPSSVHPPARGTG